LGRYLIIANPCSGRGKGRRLADAVAAGLSAGGASGEVRFTKKKGHAEEMARDASVEASSWDCVVACGGDGTIQEVANGLMAARSAAASTAYPVLGLAPAGRCNDFARSFGIRPNAVDVVAALLKKTKRRIDLGRVNGRYFCTIATFGVDAKISSFVDRMRLPFRGRPAYLYGAARLLWRDQASVFRFHGDSGSFSRRLFVASVANTPFYGGAIPLVPHADPSDGLLDLCLIDGIPRRRIATLLPRVVLGRHVEQEEISFARMSRVVIETEEPHEVWADGERMGRTPSEVEVAPNAMELFC
jgi:diacylglycerol kinase (ATP)